MAPTLEGMPAELRILILLNIPDIQSLISIVRASPVFYQTYVAARQDILNALVKRQFDHVDIAEAIAAVRSVGLHARTASNKEEIIALLDRRRRSRETIIQQQSTADMSMSPTNEPANCAESVRLLLLSARANFFMEDYCRTIPCPPWVDNTRWASEVLPLRLSDSEKARFLRAFYRLQTYCNIFGVPENDPDGGSRWFDTFDADEMWDLFFGTMPPWEVEEFGCMWAYLRRKYTRIFEEIALYSSRFKEDRPDTTSPACFELYPDSLEDREHRDRMISLGPSFLYKVLYQESPAKRRDLVAANLSGSHAAWTDLLLLAGGNDRPLIYPAEKYDVDDVQDVLRTLPPLERPNHAWVRFWFGDGPITNVRLDEMYDAMVGGQKGWEWGYAWWDRERLIEWQALGLYLGGRLTSA